MKNKKYSCLIIGCGGQGALSDCKGSGNEEKVISFAHALKEREDVFEVFYLDTNLARMNDAVNYWGGSIYECQHYDIVIITTPDDKHYRNLLDTIICKPKIVIVEKPLCSTVDEAKEIVNLYEEAGIPILLDYTRAYIPELIELKRRYETGEFGKLITANYTFNRGQLHTGTHIYHFHNWMFGEGNGKILEVEDADYRIWSIDLFFEKFHWSERRIGDEPVHSRYDYHTRYVIDNAVGFLEGKEELKCSMYDGLKSLEIMERLWNNGI